MLKCIVEKKEIDWVVLEEEPAGFSAICTYTDGADSCPKINLRLVARKRWGNLGALGNNQISGGSAPTVTTSQNGGFVASFTQCFSEIVRKRSFSRSAHGDATDADH